MLVSIFAVGMGIALGMRRAPVVALLVTALVPTSVLSERLGATIIPVGMSLLAGAVLRQKASAQQLPAGKGSQRVAPILFVVLILASVFAAHSNIYFAGPLVVALAWIPLAECDRSGGQLVCRVWVLLGGCVGVVAVSERFFYKNPFYLKALGSPISGDGQRWSIYRSYATFDHPLSAAMFLAVAVAIGAAGFFVSRRVSVVQLSAMALAAFGLLATGGRGAVLGAVAALGAMLLVLLLRARLSLGRVLLLIPLGVFGWLQFQGTVLVRSRSQEAVVSADYRGTALEIAFRVIGEHPWLGSSPKLLEDAASNAGSLTGANFENSYLGVAANFGVPAAGLAVAILVLSVRRAIRGGNWAATAALTVAVVVSGLSSIWIGNPTMLTLVALLLWLAGQIRGDVPEPSPNHTSTVDRPSLPSLRPRAPLVRGSVARSASGAGRH